jgi:hypothetical protein
MVVSASIVFTLGVIHFVYTFCGQQLTPSDYTLQISTSAPCGLAPGRLAPESPSDRIAPAHYDASPDSATWDQPAPAAPRSAHPGDRLSCVATITSCPNSLSTRLIQGECVPISSAMRLRGIASKTSRNAFAVVRSRCSNWIWPASSNTQYQVLRSPKSRPVVSFGWKIFLLCLAAVPFS